MAETSRERFRRLFGSGGARRRAIQRASTRQPLQSAALGRQRRIRSTRRQAATSRRGGNRRGTYSGGGSISAYTPEVATQAWQNTFKRLQDDYLRQASEQEALNRINQAKEEDNDLPWYQDIQQAIGLTNPFDPNQGFQNSIIGRALDIASRPAYGIAEGLQSLAEREDQSWAPSNLAGSFGDFFSGVGRGLTGEDKTGFGQVYESLQNNPSSDIGGLLRRFEEAHPELEQRFSQGVGFAGELFLDPLNRVTPTRSRVIAETGENATAATLRRAMIDAADNVARDLQANASIPAWINDPNKFYNKVATSVETSFDNTILDVATGGRRQTRLNRRTFPETAASRTAVELKAALEQPLVDLVNRLQNPVGRNIRQNFTFRKFENALRTNPEFQDFVQRLSQRLEADGFLMPGTTTREFYNLVTSMPNVGGKGLWKKVLDDVVAKYDGEITNFRDELASSFRSVTYPTLGIRVAGKEIPIKFIGRAYKAIGSKIDGKVPFLHNLFEGSSIGRILPDQLSLASTRARARGDIGIPTLQDYSKKIRDYIRQQGHKFTPDEAAQLTKYLDEGIATVGDPRMQNALDFLRQQYQEMFDTELKYGVRTVDELADDYNFVYNKGGSRTARAEFKEGRKKAFRDKSKRGAGEWDIDKARSMGLRPETNAFENLFRRFEKSKRDLTRALFFEDMLRNYSFAGKLTPDMARKLKVKRVPDSMLPQAFRTGDTIYLPETIFSGPNAVTKGAYENFVEMLSWSPMDSGRLGRNFSKLVNVIKYMQTVPNLGFHVRNMLGDIIMGLMDDINPADYVRVINKWLRKADFEVIPGHTLTWQQMVDMFHRNADAGFFKTETGMFNSPTAGRIPTDLGRRFAGNIRHMSDVREEMGRFVHFVTAYQDEARALAKRGGLSVDEIARRAEDAALWRVNAYKFDYGALHPFEKKLKTFAFPFYTYMRKAAPLLLEQLFSNPQFLTLANRFMAYNDGTAADNFNYMNIPQWVRDLGFANITDEANPWVVTSDMMNLGSLNLLANRTPQDFFSGVLSNLNPMLLAPIELGSGRDLYFNRPLNMNWQEYIMQQIPLVGDIQSEMGVDIPGIPGNVGRENPLTARLTGVGLPLRQITEQQQFQQHQTNIDNAIDNPLKIFNTSQDRYSIVETTNNQGQLIFKLIDRQSGDEIATAPTPDAIMEYANNLPGANYQEPFVNPMRPPTFQDILTRMGTP